MLQGCPYQHNTSLTVPSSQCQTLLEPDRRKRRVCQAHRKPAWPGIIITIPITTFTSPNHRMRNPWHHQMLSAPLARSMVTQHGRAAWSSTQHGQARSMVTSSL